MTGVLAIAVGALFAIGTYLLLQRSLTRIAIGLGLIGHGTNLLLLLSGGAAGRAPILGTIEGNAVADPMPQALALTAIVISFGTTAFLLAMAWRSWRDGDGDDAEHVLGDRRLARSRARAALETAIADDVVHDDAIPGEAYPGDPAPAEETR
jgi:multicomponent Na+:H+ antiporter subunit C